MPAPPRSAHSVPTRPARISRRSRAGIAVVSSLVAILAFAPQPQASAATSCADIDATPAAVGIERSAAAIGCLVNHERTSAGLNALTVDPHARIAAQRYAEDMAVRKFFAHESPEGTDPGSRLTAAGFAWSAYGENIAAGQRTPREVMAAWLDSPGHCRNLMTPIFTVAGYGVATASDGPYWVQDFGRSMSLGVTTAGGSTPSCPRLPTPFGATPAATLTTASSTPGAAPAAAPATTAVPTSAAAPTAGHSSPEEITTATASARRTGRRLRVQVVLPASAGRTAVTVRIRQGSRTVRTSTRRRVTGAQRWTMTLPKARAGRVVVRAGAAGTTAVRFR
jgi:uncharacterized protein YkwD